MSRDTAVNARDVDGAVDDPPVEVQARSCRDPIVPRITVAS